MSWLLDTNIISEVVKKEPNLKVLAWLSSKKEADLYLSTITIAEIQRGKDRLPPSRRKTSYDEFLMGLIQTYQKNILPIDIAVAQEWGFLMATAESTGRKMSVADGFIAATAAAFSLQLVTRNVSDFKHTGVSLFNPWD